MNPRLVLLFAIICSASFGQDLTVFHKRIFLDENGDSLRYRILFPENYSRDKRYPLVVFLHGAGERGNDNEKQLVHGAKMFLDSIKRKSFPCIVIFPQCPSESYWGSVEVDRSKSPLGLTFDYSKPVMKPLAQTIELVGQLKKLESISKVYIIGLSMGGMGTFEAVYRYPKLFSAAIPICGGGDVSRYDKRVKKIPFWVFHGDQDAVVDVDNSRTMVRRLEILDVEVKYTEYPGVNHNSWDYAFAEPDLLPWLFNHKR